MQTIRKGSQGAAVKEWQEIIGVTADGIFGPQTEAATKAWQREHKLVDDGIVGPLTWQSAGKDVDTSKPPKTPAAGTDKKAYETAKRAAPNMPEPQVQYALTVGRGEGFYGRGWRPTWKPGSREDQLLPLDGSPGLNGDRLDVNAAKTSHNWGAVQGSGSAGSFKWIDHHADGTAYVGNYKRYKDDSEAFLSTAGILYGGGLRKAEGAKEIKDALNRGDLKAAVYAQHKNGYFELAPEKYYDAVRKNYNQLTSNLEWQDLLTETGHRFLNWMKWAWVGGSVLGAGLLGSFFFLKK